MIVAVDCYVVRNRQLSLNVILVLYQIKVFRLCQELHPGLWYNDGVLGVAVMHGRRVVYGVLGTSHAKSIVIMGTMPMIGDCLAKHRKVA